MYCDKIIDCCRIAVRTILTAASVLNVGRQLLRLDGDAGDVRPIPAGIEYAAWDASNNNVIRFNGEEAAQLNDEVKQYRYELRILGDKE